MSHAYTEDQLVEQSRKLSGLFGEQAAAAPSPGLSQRERRTAGRTVSAIQILHRTRDLLLPRLLSGQVELGKDE